MKNRRWAFSVFIISMILILTGCNFDWLGEVIKDDQNNLPFNLFGTIESIKLETLVTSNKTVSIPDLSGGKTAIIAISPYDLSGKDHNLVITLEESPEVTMNSIDESSYAIQENQSTFSQQSEQTTPNDSHITDYFTYKGDAPRVSYQSEAGSINLLSQRNFWVRDDSSDYRLVSATPQNLASNDKIKIYIDNTVADKISADQIDSIIAKFDDIHYLVTDKFGQPDDFDSIEGTTLLITPLSSNDSNTELVGYFDENDFYINDNSNKADMIYLNADILTSGQMSKVYSNLAHEFQHLIFYSEKLHAKKQSPLGTRFFYDDRYGQPGDLWINEGFSILASNLTGYVDIENDWRIFDNYYGYFSAPQVDSLDNWEPNRVYSNYGSAGLFAYYLHDHYSGIVKDILGTSKKIENAIEDNTGRKFSDIFSEWMTANIVDRLKGIPNNRYQYSIDLKSSPNFELLTLIDNEMVKGLGVKYYVVEEGKNLVVRIEDNSFTDPINISVIIFGE